MYPDCHVLINKGDKVNCGTCRRYDWDEQKCSIKDAEEMAKWNKEHSWVERMMRENRGVRIDAD